MRLALLGDMHFHHRLVPPWRLFGKRLIGQVNLWFNRGRKFRQKYMPAIVERMMATQPDVLLLTGDLTTTAYAAEFEHAARVLTPATDQIRTILVPGNHDRYTYLATASHRMESYFRDVMPERYPHLIELSDHWRVLALNPCRPRLLDSSGKLGEEQLAEAELAIRQVAPGQGLIVLCHYTLGKPPHLPPAPASHIMADGERLLDMLRGCRGRVLFVHGHVHQPWRWRREEPEMTHVLDINAGAPCLVGRGYPFGQGFWEIELPEGAVDDAEIRMTHHVPTGLENGSPARLTWETRPTA